jgi:hypothetical protein
MKQPTLEQRAKKLESSLRWYHNARNDIIKQLGGVCAFCGHPDNLHICHVKPILRSGSSGGRPGAQRVREWREGAPLGEFYLAHEACHMTIDHAIGTNYLKIKRVSHA